MTLVTSHDLVAAVHSTHNEVEKIDLNRGGVDIAARLLGEFGVGVVFVPRSTYRQYANDAFVGAHRAVLDTQGQLSLAGDQSDYAIGTDVNAVRAYSSVGLPEWLDDACNVINGRSLRDISRSKATQAGMFKDLMAPTIIVGPNQLVSSDILHLCGERVVVKGNRSAASDSVAVVDNNVDSVNEAMQRLREERQGRGYDDAGWVVQEYDPAQPLPTVQSTLPEGAELIRAAGDNTRPEIRMYCFADTTGDTLNLRSYAMYRLNAGYESALLPIDQDTVPPAMLANAEEIVRRILEQTQSRGALVAVDQYLSTNGNVRLREVNLGNPVLAARAAYAFDALPADLRPVIGEIARQEHGRRLGELLCNMTFNAAIF